MAELRWLDQGIRELPWWKSADNLDDIASAQTHPESRTFDDRSFEKDRVGIEIEEFIRYFERHFDHMIQSLRSSLRGPMLVEPRIEFATLAAARYGIRSTEIADSVQKHLTTIARLIRGGLTKLLEDRSVRDRIDILDRRISNSARNELRMLWMLRVVLILIFAMPLPKGDTLPIRSTLAMLLPHSAGRIRQQERLDGLDGGFAVVVEKQ